MSVMLEIQSGFRFNEHKYKRNQLVCVHLDKCIQDILKVDNVWILLSISRGVDFLLALEALPTSQQLHLQS